MLNSWKGSLASHIGERPARSDSSVRALTQTRLQVILWGIVMATGLTLSLSTFGSTQVGVPQDDIDYILIAEAIAQGEPYGLNYAPESTDRTQFPFGFPLLLTPVVLMFPDSFDALKAVSLVAVLANASILFWAWPWLSRRSQWWGLAVAGLYLLSPDVLKLSRQIASESIFLTACLFAIVLTERAARNRPAGWWGGWLSLTLVLAAFIRSIGITLVVACFAYLLIVYGFRFWKRLVPIVAQMGLFVAAVVTFTSVEARDVVPTRYVDSYLSILGLSADGPQFPGQDQPVTDDHITLSDEPVEAPETIETPVLRRLIGATEVLGMNPSDDNAVIELAENSEMHVEEHVRQAVLPLGGGESERKLFDRIGVPQAPVLLGIAVFGLIVFGAIRWYAREQLSPFFLFFVIYVLSLFTWLWRDIRFLNPVLPQLLLSFLIGIEGVVMLVLRRFIPRERRQLVVHAGIVFVVIVLLAGSIVKAMNPEDSRDYKGDLAARTRWIEANTEPSAVILSEEPELDYAYGGRKTVPYPMHVESAADLEMYLADHDINYLIVAPETAWRADYREVYSPITEEVARQADALALTGVLTRIELSETNLVRVYQFHGTR